MDHDTPVLVVLIPFQSIHLFRAQPAVENDGRNGPKQRFSDGQVREFFVNGENPFPQSLPLQE